MENVYLSFAANSFKQKFAYRVDSYINIVGSLLKLIIQMSVWSALIANNINVKGITLQDMVNYVTINMIVITLTNSSMAKLLAQRVVNGSIALDFIKPINLKLRLFSEEFGSNLFRTVFSSLPVFVFAVIFFDFRLPESPIYAIIFLFSIILGIFITYQINYILGLLCFWFKTSFYVDWFLKALFELFAGTFVPLWFYPNFLYKISILLPFHLISFEPISIYIGKKSLVESLQILFLQMVWGVVLLLLEKFIWNKAQDKVIIHGG